MEQDEIARTILRYIAEHSDCADTLEGIMTWWMFRQVLGERMDEVREAVASLVARGVLREHTWPGAGTTYHVDKRVLEELRGRNEVPEPGT